jgi:acyl CoA:acetate/3-ketoacid CoA transferase beta subunit
VITDGEALLVSNGIPLGVDAPDKTIEAWNPNRTMFDVVWSGRRHVMMGASQLDAFGNQNFAFIGDPERPKVQLLGMRGAPGNTVQNITSYWIPAHSPRIFVENIDVVSGIGYDRAAELGDWVKQHHELRRVVTNLAVLDFGGPDHRMRLLTVHPGGTVDDVVAATGFELALADTVEETRPPTPEETEVIHRLDPRGMRGQEVPG